MKRFRGRKGFARAYAGSSAGGFRTTRWWSSICIAVPLFPARWIWGAPLCGCWWKLVRWLHLWTIRWRRNIHFHRRWMRPSIC